MVPFSPSGIVTLTTDFGLSDPFVGVMKGCMLSRCATLRLVDLTHHIAAYQCAEAGFWLARSYGYFPAGTVHVAVVDPGVGTDRRIIVAEADAHVFLAPDNGLLGSMLKRVGEARLHCVEWSRLSRLGLGPISATFHGRDIFAPLAAELAAGRLQPMDLGSRIDTLQPSAVPEPREEPARVQGVIVAVDRFGNLISNIDSHLLRRFDHPMVSLAGRTFPLHRTYGAVRPGEYLALVNAFDVVEVARAEGRAADDLAVSRGEAVVVSGKDS